jgi:hypothetical protein
MNAAERAERRRKAEKCFRMALLWKKRGNELLKPVREQPFKKVECSENATIIPVRQIDTGHTK